MTSVYFCYPDAQASATITTTTADTGYSSNNLRSGARHQHYKANAASTSLNIDFDLGVGNTANPDYFILARADFIRRADSGTPTLTFYADDNSSFTSPESASLSLTAGNSAGKYSEDCIKLPGFSTAYRYFRVNIATTSSIAQRLSKIYFGNWLDLGRDPLVYARTSFVKHADGFKRRIRVIDLQYRGITDAKRQEYLSAIGESIDIHPIFIYDASDLLLNGEKLFHCYIERQRWTTNHYSNDLDVSLVELT